MSNDLIIRPDLMTIFAPVLHNIISEAQQINTFPLYPLKGSSVGIGFPVKV